MPTFLAQPSCRHSNRARGLIQGKGEIGDTVNGCSYLFKLAIPVITALLPSLYGGRQHISCYVHENGSQHSS